MNAVSSALYSATYNPAAEKAKAEQQVANDGTKSTLKDQIDKVKAYRITVGTLTTKANTKLDTIISKAQTVYDSSSSDAAAYRSAQDTVYSAANDVFKQQQYYRILKSFNDLFPKQIKVWKGDKLIEETDIAKLTEYLKGLAPFIAGADDKSADEIQAKIFVVKQDLTTMLNKTKVADVSIELDEPTLDDKLKAQGAVADQTFDSGKLFSDVWDNTTMFVGYFFYITLGLLGGMLAANDAIGREPKYRVLFFIYGFIFCPFVLVYYLIRVGLGTAPKLYTMLPITQIKGETSLGSFFLFPFYFQEDLPARKKMVDFLTECATLVGKTFDPNTLPPLPGQTTSLTENIGAAISASLPNLSTLRLRRGDFFPSIKSVVLESRSDV